MHYRPFAAYRPGPLQRVCWPLTWPRGSPSNMHTDSPSSCIQLRDSLSNALGSSATARLSSAFCLEEPTMPQRPARPPHSSTHSLLHCARLTPVSSSQGCPKKQGCSPHLAALAHSVSSVTKDALHSDEDTQSAGRYHQQTTPHSGCRARHRRPTAELDVLFQAERKTKNERKGPPLSQGASGVSAKCESELGCSAGTGKGRGGACGKRQCVLIAVIFMVLDRCQQIPILLHFPGSLELAP